VIEQVRAGLVLLAVLVAVGPANANSQFVVDPEVGNNAFTAVFDTPIGEHARLYRWTDDQGVVHLTNLWDEVPPQYRQQVKPPKPGCSESGRCAGAC
jgi:hypothetical protein